MYINFDLLIDARLDDPPWPMVKTKEALNNLSAGAILKVIVKDNYGTISNIRTLIKNNPYELLREEISQEGLFFFIKKL
jgi:TusA-related sulfurtransferase